MKIVWKDIPQYEGYYQVSNIGEVRSVTREITSSTGQKYIIEGRLLKQTISPKGYHQVSLNKNGIRTLYYVHILVACIFIKKPKNKKGKLTVNHKDGNKSNNKKKNLEWVTYAENNQHAYDTNLHGRGEKHYRSKLTENDVYYIKELYNKGEDVSHLYKNYGVSRATIRDILIGKTWKHIQI